MSNATGNEYKPNLKINDYDDIAADYDEIMGDDYANNMFDTIFNSIKRNIDESKENRYLDLACGSGAFICKMQKKINAECFGIDLSKNQIEYANHKLKSNNVSADLKVGDITKIEFPNKCDIISINFDALNHIRDINDWKQLFEKVYSSLNNNGVFFFDINTQKRLLDDWSYPEVIVKENITYVQIGYEPITEDDITRRKILMQIFSSKDDLIKKSSALVEQISLKKDFIFEILDKAGFVKIEEIKIPNQIKSKHIFLKNRIFINTRK